MTNGVMDPEIAADTAAMSSAGGDDFEYRPLAILAPVALFFGVCSVAAILGWAGVIVAAVAVLVSALAVWQIARADGEYSGMGLAKIGLALSAIFLMTGSGYHSYVYATEVPEGYERLSFAWLSKQAWKIVRNQPKAPEEVANLEGRRVFIKGYMYPTRQTHGLSEFVLVKDNGDCCFGGQPKLTDMVVVRFKDGMTVDHRDQQLVGVAGVFHAGAQTRSGELEAVYTLDGTHFR